MKEEDIILHAVTEDDCKDLWIWRNHPEVRKSFFNKDIVPWEEHKKWFYLKIKSKNTKIYIARQGKNKIGVIRFEIEQKAVRISTNLNPDYFGRGLGTKIIQYGSERFLTETKINKPIIAEIKKDNIASRKAFAKSGYKCAKETDTDKELIYIYKGINSIKLIKKANRR